MSLLSAHPAWVIFFSALLLRVILVLSIGPSIPEASDKLDRYDPIALSLMRGEGFSLNGKPTAISGPVYPVLLSGLYSLFGYSATVVRLFVSVLDAGHAVIFYWIAKRAFGGSVASLTALTLVVSPFTIYCILTLAPEIPFLFFHALFILYLIAALQTGRARDFLIGGMALGAATLSRAVPLLLPLAVLPFFMINAQRRNKGLLNFAVFLLGFVLLVGPWIGRNYVFFHQFVPVQTLGGSHLHRATPKPATLAEQLRERAELQSMNHTEQDKALYARSWQRIKDNPGQFVRLMGQRLLEMWYRTDSRRFEQPLFYANSALLVLAAAGIVLSRQRWREHSLFYVVIAYYVILHMILVTILRYTLPIIPVITAFAMVSIVRLWERAVHDGRVTGARAAT